MISYIIYNPLEKKEDLIFMLKLDTLNFLNIALKSVLCPILDEFITNYHIVETDLFVFQTDEQRLFVRLCNLWFVGSLRHSCYLRVTFTIGSNTLFLS